MVPNEMLARILTSIEYEPEELARKNLVSKQFCEVISSIQTPQYWQREIYNRFGINYHPNPYINWTKLYAKHAAEATDRVAAYAEYTQSLPQLPPHIPRWAKLVVDNGGTSREKNEMRQIVLKYSTYTDPECQYYTALSFDKAAEDYDHNHVILLIKSAAKQGFVKAMDELCDMYYYGRLGEKGLYGRISMERLISMKSKKALKYARLAAAQGSATAQSRVGFFQKQAEIEPNHEENLRNLLLAGAQSHIIALNTLGDCYLKGIGTAPNLELAFGYYRMAAELGSRDAAKNAQSLEIEFLNN